MKLTTRLCSHAWHCDSDGQQRCQTVVSTRYLIVVGLLVFDCPNELYNIMMLFFWHLAWTVIKSAIRVIVSLKVTIAMCGSLASIVTDSKNNDDAFLFTHRQLVRANR